MTLSLFKEEESNAKEKSKKCLKKGSVTVLSDSGASLLCVHDSLIVSLHKSDTLVVSFFVISCLPTSILLDLIMFDVLATMDIDQQKLEINYWTLSERSEIKNPIGRSLINNLQLMAHVF